MGASAMPTPLISVIVPVMNALPYLDQALDSIQNQTLHDIEIICLNDGSTDDSLAVLQKHASNDGRIIIVDKANEGYGATCNRGIDVARGSWISIVEPDDWIEPGMFADMIAYAKSLGAPAAGIDIIKTPYLRVWRPDTPQQRIMNCSFNKRIKPANQPFTMEDPGVVHLICHHPSIWSALYRKSFLQTKKIRFREFPGAGWADNPFLYETLFQAAGIAYLERAYYCYREDTPEKAAAFAQRSSLLPLERWNDMQDVLDHLNVTSDSIRRAHCERGFTYLGDILEHTGLEDNDLKQAATRMFKRMDAHLVIDDPKVPTNMKELFFTLRGEPTPTLSSAPYAANLVKQALYNLVNTGIGNTLYMTRTHLQNKDKRTGE